MLISTSFIENTALPRLISLNVTSKSFTPSLFRSTSFDSPIVYVFDELPILIVAVVAVTLVTSTGYVVPCTLTVNGSFVNGCTVTGVVLVVIVSVGVIAPVSPPEDPPPPAPAAASPKFVITILLELLLPELSVASHLIVLALVL